MNNYKIVCTNCKRKEKSNIVKCKICGSSLVTEYNHIVKKFNPFDYLPVTSNELNIGYDELSTPIKKIERNGWAKLEYKSLTSSSKTREAIIEYAVAKKFRYKGIVVASTGNMAIALGYFCKNDKLQYTIVIPMNTVENKVKLLRKLKAKLIFINGNYDDCVENARNIVSEKKYFLASLQAYRFDGYKTIAYDIYEQFKKGIPENIIVPLGDGTTYVGIYKGFLDLKNAGAISNIPRMIGVQDADCDPIKRKFDEETANEYRNKVVCQAIDIKHPLDMQLAINTAHETGGKILSYVNKEIMIAYNQLLKSDILAEYTSALTYCPVLDKKIIGSYLLIITGSGLRNN